MEIVTHTTNNTRIAEVVAAGIVIGSAEDGLALLGDLYYQDFNKIIIYEKNITPDFFNLKNGMAGELLQKFSNYRVQLAIVGDFSRFSGKSISDFIVESNKVGHVNFVGSVSDALSKLLE